MTVHYVDASAWAKLLVEEPESYALEDWVNRELGAGSAIASAHLLLTELHRLGQRVGVAPLTVTAALSVVDLVLPSVADYRAAGLLQGPLRSLDALHVAFALGLSAISFVTYDERQAQAARAAGIPVVAPGSGGDAP